MNLYEWAARWGVSAEALTDLRIQMTAPAVDPAVKPGKSEAAVSSQIRLEATRKGGRLWRNNVGATYTPDGAFVRYGLANDSKKLNDVMKSSDLIGLQPVLITPGHVGHTVGQFVAREVKAAGWSYAGTTREIAQLRFIQAVAALGGNAGFANGVGSL